MENTAENHNNTSNIREKKIILYLITLTIVLIYISIFFIYDIVDRGTINASQTITIPYYENEVDPNNNKINDDGAILNNEINSNHIVETRLRILQGTKEWNELAELNIFKRSTSHITQNKIAPGAESSYTFTVENYADTDMLYNIEYLEENPYNINMKYKLKLNGNYVAGNDETWVQINQLNQSDLKIKSNTADVFELDWKWIDAENDTEIGKTEGANYKLNIKVEAEQVVTNE